MKSGLGLIRKFRLIYVYANFLRFYVKKKLFGFEIANQYIQRVDKISLQMILKRNGAKIGDNCDIETGLIFHNCRDYSNFSIGNNCHIGKRCFFDLKNNILIGNNVTISMNSTVLTHIDVGKSKLSSIYKSTDIKTVVEDNVYIGSNCLILMGVVLNRNSFIGAGSVVNKSIPENSLAYGQPAKVIKHFSDK